MAPHSKRKKNHIAGQEAREEGGIPSETTASVAKPILISLHLLKVLRLLEPLHRGPTGHV